MADSVPISLTPNTPYGLHLDEKEAAKLADFAKQCAKDQRALELTTKSYENCVSKPEIANSWWQKPDGFWAAMGGSLILGIIVGASWR